MRKAHVALLVALVIVFVSAEAFAQCPLSRGRSGSSSTRYVLVQKVGLDVTCTICTTMDQVKERGAAVIKENKVIRKANKVLTAEVKGLKIKLSAKKLKVAKTDDTTTKAELEQEIDTLKTQIQEKESARRPVVRLIGPVKFLKAEDAEKYVADVQARAEKAKAKAEADA